MPIDEDTKAPETTQDFGRRELLGLAGAAAAVTLVAGRAHAAAPKPPEAKPEAKPAALKEYVLPPLPYAKNALDGFLSAEILELHHDKHHAGYVKGLNAALADLAAAREKGEFGAVKGIERNLAFHGSGHVLHSLYWTSMSPKGGGAPKEGALKTAIDASFGSFDALRKHFTEATKVAEASAWGVLAYEPLGDRLVILAIEDHQNMGFQGATPLLVCDVWEHAYYLRYKSDRAGYVEKFFDVAAWDFAEQQLKGARRG